MPIEGMVDPLEEERRRTIAVLINLASPFLPLSRRKLSCPYCTGVPRSESDVMSHRPTCPISDALQLIADLQAKG